MPVIRPGGLGLLAVADRRTVEGERRQGVEGGSNVEQARIGVSVHRQATDAASEGIDLQNHCNNLIQYEIPWNPNRMEQRNGRIDRHGQKQPEVHIFHFVGQGYLDRERRLIDTKVGDLETDLEFLMRAVRKVEQIREDLGKVGPVIAEQVEDAMLGRRQRLDTMQAEGEAQPSFPTQRS